MAHTVLNMAVRRFTTTSMKSYASPPPAAGAVKIGGMKFWKRISFFVGFPAIFLCFINAYVGHMADHEKERPPFVKWPYMYLRVKKYPWRDGVQSFFHNPKVNALPDGYEEDEIVCKKREPKVEA